MEKPVDFISRNWRKYNKKLVKRGEFYLLSDFIQYWDEELAHMNENKRGSPFEFPPSFIDFAAFLKIVFNLPYRQLQGVIKKLSTYVAGLQSADYTTLWRRIRATTFEIEPKKAQTEGEKESETEGVIAAIDATGMKVSNRGEWMREKWKKRRGWIKVHIIVDAQTKEFLGIEITDERVGDSKEFKTLIEQAEYTLNGRKIVLVLVQQNCNSDMFTV
jgi:hypothetical protein